MNRGTTSESNATPGAPGRIALVLLLGRLSSMRRLLILMATCTISLGWGLGMLTVERHFAGVRDDGGGLSGFTTLLANGAAPITILPGWIAAACFGLASVHLRRGAAEPSLSRRDPRDLSATELRAGLRREYRAVGVALVVVAGLSLLDAGRLMVDVAATVIGDSIAQSTLGPVALETTGLATAAGVLGLWTVEFRAQLERLGAL